MITRRDALRLAAAAAGTAAAPFAVSPAVAAALLDGPMPFDPDARRLDPALPAGDPTLDPGAFAAKIDGLDWQDWFEHGSPEEMAAYKQTYNAALDALGVRVAGLPFDHPIVKLDEAALGLWCAAWMAGVRAGAASEHLRLALVTPRRTCRRCHGNGRLWGGTPWRHHDDGTNAETCSDCGGAGTVATPSQSLAAD